MTQLRGDNESVMMRLGLRFYHTQSSGSRSIYLKSITDKNIKSPRKRRHVNCEKKIIFEANNGSTATSAATICLNILLIQTCIECNYTFTASATVAGGC